MMLPERSDLVTKGLFFYPFYSIRRESGRLWYIQLKGKFSPSPACPLTLATNCPSRYIKFQLGALILRTVYGQA